MKDAHDVRTLPTRHLIALFACSIALLVAISFISSDTQKPFASSEVKFTDASKQGLSIVPASCPSYPHYSGECDTTTQTPGQCSLSSSSWVITKGQSATLSWVGPSGPGTLGIPVTYVSGSINPGIGTVAQTGSAPVVPQSTTVYRYTGTQAWGGVFKSAFECDATITVLPADYCPTGQVLGGDGICHAANCPDGQVRGTDGICHSINCPNGQLLGTDGLCHAITCPAGSVLGSDGLCHANNCGAPFLFCGTGSGANNLYQRTYSSAPACAPLDSFYATCRYGCSNGACNAAPSNPDATITARPAIVRQGDTAQVVWSSVDVASCTVSSNGGDSWTGNTGTQISKPIIKQTTFTLTCTANASGGTVTKSATVNILPTFQEQ